MAIIFKARVLLELGAELISSDAVALYELIKNSVDANSPTVKLSVQIVFQPSAQRALLKRWGNPKTTWNASAFMQDVEEHLEPSATPEKKIAFLNSLSLISRESAEVSLKEASFKFNKITVSDTGDGMDKQALTDCYLTVGTPGQLLRKEEILSNLDSTERLPLGEKGIGRLAAMRIGHFIKVTSCVEGNPRKFMLEMDWRPIFADPTLGLEALNFEPDDNQGKKTIPKGTSITIRDIQTDWNLDKLKELAQFDLAKLADPFKSSFANQFLKIEHQGKDESLILVFKSADLKYADAICEINFRAGTVGATDDSATTARLQVTTKYARFERDETILHEGAHLADTVSHQPKRQGIKPKASDKLPRSNEVIDALQTLGDFEAKFWWFNRGRLMREEKELWTSSLRDFVRNWSGGLLVYRDGYRVYPYGSAADDWLDLDRKALASSAYKLNRAQIVGYLRISSKKNRRLLDQTNREGFRDCPEKEALRRLLRQAIIADCKTFLERVDKDFKAADEETLRDIDNRIGDASQSAAKNLLRLQQRIPGEAPIIQSVLSELAEVEAAWERAKETLKAKEEEVEQYSHLAGVGLMVELLAHELARVTDDALLILSDKKTAKDPGKLDALAAVLKTLNKRVRVIDELSIPGRQRKSLQDIGSLVRQISEFYETKLERHKIALNISSSARQSFDWRVEKGQILQLFDNLLSNSVYWLARRLDRNAPPAVNIAIDPREKSVTVTDNGPGIPADVGSRVFDPFYTSKPGGGRGLGLYIAKRLAKENGISLELLPAEAGIHRGFLIRFGGEGS